VIEILKRLVGRLPLAYQQELKRLWWGHHVRKGTFRGDDPEFARLHEWVMPGDWVLDIGANVGHYAARLSELVGARGRVLAFEPIPETFELLATNMARLPYRNVTLFNAAVSDRANVVGMTVPVFQTGLGNFYMARVTASASDVQVLAMTVDSLTLPTPIKLAKIDVEGHELQVLEGMTRILRRDHPVLIVEGQAPEVQALLDEFGYGYRDLPDSPNRVFLHEFDGTRITSPQREE
jgi:FkbM family methyltransferase